jgi:hypothetical protein
MPGRECVLHAGLAGRHARLCVYQAPRRSAGRSPAPSAERIEERPQMSDTAVIVLLVELGVIALGAVLRMIGRPG